MVQLVERQRLIVAGVSARRRAGFSLVELVVVLVVIAVLAAIAYVAYAVLVRDAGTKALMATAYSVDREAVGLSTFDLSSPASQVGFVLDGSGNGFRWTEVSGVWDSNGVVVTPTAEGGYVLTKGGAEAVCYSPSLVPATAGVVRTLSEAGGVCAAAGAPVSPDPSTPPSGPEFSVLGILDDVFNSNVADVLLRQPVSVVVAQPDGMVVAGGNFLDAGHRLHRLARFTTDGLLDETFRDNVAVAALTSPVESVALQLDGKLVVGGWFTNEGYSYLARFNADGTLDDVFNTNVAAAGLDSVVRNVLVQPDGKIVVGGEFNALGMNLVRFNTDGTLDETFVNSSEFTGRPNAMVLQPDGKIVAATGNGTYVLKRFNTDGTLDAVFGSNAAATGVCLCSVIPLVNLAVQPDGKIVAGGSFNGGASGPDLVRFNADGTLDSGFTGNVVNGAPSLRFVSAVVIQPDGKIVVSEVFGGLVMRFNADGTLDSSFNSPTGSVVVKFAPTGFAVLPGEGGLVVGGFELVEESQGLPTLVKLK